MSTLFTDIPDRKAHLDAACERRKREPLRLSVMTGCVVGADKRDFTERLRRTQQWIGRGDDPEQLLELVGGRWFAGTVEDVVERIRSLEATGVERVMLQTLLHDDVEMMRLIGEHVIPAVS